MTIKPVALKICPSLTLDGMQSFLEKNLFIETKTQNTFVHEIVNFSMSRKRFVKVHHNFKGTVAITVTPEYNHKKHDFYKFN